MGKIAGSLFVTSLIIMFLGIALLYTRFRTEAVRMNRLLQESNLEVAGKNIAEKMDAAEYTAISLFFDKNMRKTLLSKHAVEDPVELHNQVYGNFLRILNAASSISQITLYRKDGFSVSAGLENNFGHSDYSSCMEEIEEYDKGFSEESSYGLWIPVTIALQNGIREPYFMNVRILRDVSSNEPVGMLVFYVKEKVLRNMYSFFGEESFLTDADGTVISAGDRSEIGKKVALGQEEAGTVFYVPVGDKDGTWRRSLKIPF